MTLDPMGNLTWIAPLIGHAFVLFFAYVVGLGPAAATGFFYALADALAPASWPRALLGAFIGAAFSHWLATTLFGWFAGEFDAPIRHVFIACGAVAGFSCALAAQILGLGLATRKDLQSLAR